MKVTDEPYTHEFVVNSYGTDFLFKVQLRLGFRVNQRVNTYLYQIVADLVQRHQLAPQNHRYSIYREHSSVGDFRFCLLRKVLTPETDISGFDYRIMSLKYFIRRLCGSPARWYGLENSSIIFEYVPLFSKTKRQHKLKRIDFNELSSKVVDAGLTPEQRTSVLDEEDEDIFMAAMHDERQLNAENAEAKLYAKKDKRLHAAFLENPLTPVNYMGFMLPVDDPDYTRVMNYLWDLLDRRGELKSIEAKWLD